MVDYEGQEIKLSFSLTRENLQKKYGKSKIDGIVSEVYLLDEIYVRLYKMYIEFIYCMRFIPYANKLDTITAKISFVDNKSFVDFHAPISIKLIASKYLS